jgi:uncharacterized protein YggE
MANLSEGLAAALLLALAAPVHAEEKPSPPAVSVIGEASAEVRPDMAIVSFEISDDRPTPLDASNENARLAGAVIDGLKGSGIDAKDISTVGASLSPILSEQRDPKTNALIRTFVGGYHAKNVLRVKLREIDRAGAIIGTSVQNGALYDGVAFELSDRDARLDLLRTQAAANAVHRAGLYAEGAGMKLGAIRSLNAGDSPRAYAEFAPRAKAMAPQAAVAAPVRIEPGVVTLSESVNATFDLVGP